MLSSRVLWGIRVSALWASVAERVEMMRRLQGAVARLSPVPPEDAFIWAFDFGLWEQFRVMPGEATQNVGTSAAVVVLITAVFLVHPRVSLLVFVCLVLTDINIIGYMAFWGVPVNSISMSCLVLAVGLTVDYSAHVAHAFLLQPGDDAAARVAAALRKVGAPIVSGALTTVLGIGFLEFGNSVTYFVFFKMFFITIVLMI